MGQAYPGLNPRVLRERLAGQLRQERDRANLSQGQAASRVSWSVSKLQRIETGVVGISVTDTRALLDLYGTSDSKTVDRLTTLARAARRRDRFTPYRKYLSPEYQTLLSYEESASEVLLVNSFLVPGLLQTKEYARALLSVKHTGEKLEGLVEARAVRQEILDREDGPRFLFVVDEGALYRQIGGREVLLAQLVHLRRVADRPNVELHVIPYSAGAHLGLWELYVIMAIPPSVLTEEPAGSIVYRESGNAEFLVRDEVRINRYKDSFSGALAQSLDQVETCGLLDDLIRQVDGPGVTSPPPTR